jgi:Spy/CpxP family protein refolding chaperone
VKRVSNTRVVTMAMVMIAMAAVALAQHSPATADAAAASTNAVAKTRLQMRNEQIEQMVVTLGLDSNQVARIRVIYDEQDAALAKSKESIDAQRKALAAAVQSGNVVEQDKIKSEMHVASSRMFELDRKYTRAIMDVMTPEQQLATRVNNIYLFMINDRLREYALSDEQKAKIRDMCMEVVKALPPTTRDASEDVKKLIAEVETHVLTAEQRQQVLTQSTYYLVMRELRGSILTPEQEQKVRALCEEAAKAAMATPRTPPATPAALCRDVMKSVRKTVLRDDQNLELDSARPTRP